MKWLRETLRSWLGINDAPVADEKPQGMSVAQQMFARAGEHTVVHRKVEPPRLPPQVRGDFVYDATKDPGGLGPPMLAFDDAQTAPNWAYLNQTNCGLGFPGYAYLAELAQRSEYRSPSETIASEMTREWIDVTVRGKAAKKEQDEDLGNDEDIDGGLEDKIEQIEQAFEEFGVRELFRRIAEQDGLFGRSQLFINVDQGGNPDEVNQLPLVVDPETIKKGSLKGFKVIEPLWTTPYNYNSTDPTRPDFYKPRAWFVIGKRIHASRLLTFVSREVPDILKPAYNFGGIALSQLMEPDVFQWLRTRNSVSNLIHNFSVMCLKTDMAAVLSGGDAVAAQGLLDRAKLFVQTRDNQGLMLLDMKREEMEQVAVPLSNLDKLQGQAQEHMAASSRMPLVKLTGITPSGLNASSEGEIQVWYDLIRAMQIFFFGPHLKHVLNIVQLHLFGEIDEAIHFTFVPLNSPTVKELSEIRKANAETDDKYVAMGAISPEEVRERVGSDPDSGYNNLSGPAPTPPVVEQAEHGAGLDKDKAEHGAALSEEAAQAAHERQLEADKAAGKD